MNKISVAIPTFFSSGFIDQTISSIKDFSLVEEVVICDDSENHEEFQNLEKIVKKVLEKSEIKLNISKNNKNLGGFKNKYLCIEKASNNYIYQIFDNT